ncbi:MAG: type I methionyl aminopeptidase [Victivallales bacterium]|nr:type I methionyl aminopeptidase [Victivallales bacterium]
MSPKKDCVVNSDSAVSGIRLAARAAAEVREKLPGMIRPGMTTKHVDELAAMLIATTGGKSAFLGYKGYPGQICISVNDEVVHGIGSSLRSVTTGDVLSLDIGVELNGFVGDNATTMVVGGVVPTSDIQRLLDGTREALEKGVRSVLAGNRVRDISAAVEKTAKRHKLGIVREYVGHACGRHLHEPPEIPNYIVRDRGPVLKPGMVLAIEPMLNLGGKEVVTDRDKWTVRTRDGSISAHFEHMVLVTDNKPEILTWLKTQ